MSMIILWTERIQQEQMYQYGHSMDGESSMVAGKSTWSLFGRRGFKGAGILIQSWCGTSGFKISRCITLVIVFTGRFLLFHSGIYQNLANAYIVIPVRRREDERTLYVMGHKVLLINSLPSVYSITDRYKWLYTWFWPDIENDTYADTQNPEKNSKPQRFIGCEYFGSQIRMYDSQISVHGYQH